MDSAHVTQNEARQAAQAYLNQRLADSKKTMSTKPFTFPVINIERSFSSNIEDRKAVALEIRNACMTSGFFHITGHGIPEETRQTILEAAKRFTTLPIEKKEALHVKHSPYLRGFEPADFSYVNPDDWNEADAPPETKEAFNWGYEAGLDPTGGDGKYRELDGKSVNGNVWPSEEDLPGFYAQVKEYYGAILQLARHLFRLFALALELDENYFDEMCTHPGGIARLLYYPPSKVQNAQDTHQKGKEIGLGAHSDYECFTILLTSTANGLEILSPDNQWVSAPAAEGSFIINVADFLMRWSNGVFRSTVHRVVPIPEARLSCPFFFSINYEQLVETLPSCITPDNPSRYKPIRAGEYVLERLRATARDG
ncbi:hypothetical protein CERZMDRAFT_114009 [Cercospora zeae-maydis SCOH1-5]|uniref:Fe2OG dioxygenase domain-containing protein n=1 Tax=Cercospora zeae-maydis SCOH1-5 TaxID=717836 RepID=A0A6A6F6B6_9PEZI|nr:hypothetical protein CERZMDRAFT_114009 [Cercospora zeae-maydis SCOH1-5]